MAKKNPRHSNLKLRNPNITNLNDKVERQVKELRPVLKKTASHRRCLFL